MMLLESRGVQLSGPDPVYQSQLFGEISLEPGVAYMAFSSAPGALARATTRRMQRHGIGLAYEVYPAQLPPSAAGAEPPVPPVVDGQAMLDVITARLATGPVIALLQSGLHWVVIYGENQGRFFICSPKDSSALSRNQQPHHSGPCPPCEGGTETVLTSEGLRLSLTPIFTTTRSFYSGQRIVLLPVATPAAPPPPAPDDAAAVPPAPAPPPADPLSVPPTLIPPPEMKQPQAEQAKEKARAVLPEAALNALRPEVLKEYSQLFRQHGERLSSAILGAPVPVAHLTDPEGDYFLIPIFTNGLREPWFVGQVSAVTGSLLRLDCIRALEPDENSWIYAVLNKEQSEKKLAALLQRCSADGWQSAGRLVWKPTLLSLSPLEPFHELRRGTETGYMDLWGAIHTDLDVERQPPSDSSREPAGK